MTVALAFFIFWYFLPDDKKLTTTLKRIGVTNIPAIEEVNMFKNDGEVIHFVGPKGEEERYFSTGLPWLIIYWYQKGKRLLQMVTKNVFFRLNEREEASFFLSWKSRFAKKRVALLGEKAYRKSGCKCTDALIHEYTASAPCWLYWSKVCDGFKSPIDPILVFLLK